MRGARFDRRALAQALEQGSHALKLDLSPEQLRKLLDYTALLVKWNSVYNLTAVREPARMVTQHLLDSLAAVPAIANARRLLDVGTGAGLPGIVFAIWAQEAAPGMQITLVDTVQKKTAFLTQVKAELGLANVTVLHARVEKMEAAEKFDLIVSRAFAELNDFVTWSAHLLAPDGRFVAMKGVMPSAEIDALPSGWRIAASERLQVPGLDAERHLVIIERSDEEQKLPVTPTNN